MRVAFSKGELVAKINGMPEDDSHVIALKKSELQLIMNFGLTELSKNIRFCNDEKGFESPSVDIHTKLLLAVSEICEAQEELRDGKLSNEIYYRSEGIVKSELTTKNGKPCGFSVEIADAIIRLLDICAAFKIDIDNVIKIKLEYNKTRPPKHGRQF